MESISYFLGAQSHSAVTIPVGVRHEVSDAATATRLAAENLSVIQSFSVFDGKDPTVFDTTPDNPGKV